MNNESLQLLYKRVEFQFDVSLDSADRLHLRRYVLENNINPKNLGYSILYPIVKHLLEIGHQSKRLEKKLGEIENMQKGLVQDWLDRKNDTNTQ